MKKAISWIFTIIAVIMIVWVGISYIDICAHNLSGGSDSSWNFFNILLNR